MVPSGSGKGKKGRVATLGQQEYQSKGARADSQGAQTLPRFSGIRVGSVPPASVDHAQQKFSIPTVYNGTRFRSKFEADWAMTFDTLDLPWEYEREGHYFGKQFYLPDFYLPRSNQFVEVKAVYQPSDVKKIGALLEYVRVRKFTGPNCPDVAIVACTPNGDFVGWIRTRLPTNATVLDLSRRASRDVALFCCAVCKGWWFADHRRSWRCQCCGANTPGDENRPIDERLASHVAQCIGTPISKFPVPAHLVPF